MSKCYKCGSEYVKTPVCAECGTIPILDGEMSYLKEKVNELEVANVALREELSRVRSVITANKKLKRNTKSALEDCLSILRYYHILPTIHTREAESLVSDNEKRIFRLLNILEEMYTDVYQQD